MTTELNREWKKWWDRNKKRMVQALGLWEPKSDLNTSKVKALVEEAFIEGFGLGMTATAEEFGVVTTSKVGRKLKPNVEKVTPDAEQSKRTGPIIMRNIANIIKAKKGEEEGDRKGP